MIPGIAFSGSLLQLLLQRQKGGIRVRFMSLSPVTITYRASNTPAPGTEDASKPTPSDPADPDDSASIDNASTTYWIETGWVPHDENIEWNDDHTVFRVNNCRFNGEAIAATRVEGIMKVAE